ncbi:putative MscS family protein YkuT [Caloramator mitchellensis]|uniref:Putative MscS family protein YkuT n=1 Tax=Caloramator mitchellensis TaxID=908809 RepID=A0A0R3JSL1_CALMK|nr:mechanosensitive ion channel family protein [Caloramator mitchellensis]KRQ85962.1 putative MscS family protein YkuT [Caloramator mitchellensis]
MFRDFLYSKGIFSENQLLYYLSVFIKAIIIIIITKIAISIGSKLIHKFFEGHKKSRFGLNDKKADTLNELFKNLLRYIIYFVSAIWVLETLGFDIKTLIAVTGVAGVAIGFGAQSLVKDVISGFFILFEDQFAVGDYISIDGFSGIVEVLGLRVTKIRDFSGELHIIPNGTINRVTNKSRGNMRALVDVSISYEDDIERAVEVLNNVCHKMKQELDYIVEGPTVLGVVKLSEHGVDIRVVAKTIPMKQWEAEMELRKRIKMEFDKEKIEIPYPKRIIYSKERE